MPYYKLKKIHVSNDEIYFVDADLTVNDYFKQKEDWEITLATVENGKVFSNAIRNKEKVNIKIDSDDGFKFEGRVLVTNVRTNHLGTDVKLKGDGKLKEIQNS